MKIMTLNVLFGGEERFERLLDVIRREGPDFLVLQECLGWEDGERLARVARALGIPASRSHARLAEARPRGSGKRYHVGIVSRPPIEAWVVHNDPQRVGHCIAEAGVQVEGSLVTVFGAHFDSHGEEQRLREARYLNGVLRERGDFDYANYLLAGDLNALSPKDPYPAGFAAALAAGAIDKYGHPPRFDAIRELEELGWLDALRLQGGDGEWVTARRSRGGVEIEARTDYVFCSPSLQARLKACFVAPVSGATDHEGLVADFGI